MVPAAAKDGEDELFWVIDNNGIFSIKSCYAALEERIFGIEGWVVQKKQEAILPPKVSLFVWMA